MKRSEHRFCSSRKYARPSDPDEWTTINRSSHGPGGDATFLAQAHDEAWCAERAVRERADGPFSVSDRFRVMNSKISYFIFYSEIV
jgi:hypothetical protein